jgi:geranylgeranyl pyrophosphate synthase
MTKNAAAPAPQKKGPLQAKFPPFVDTMPPKLTEFYRRCLPWVIEGLNADYPREGTVSLYQEQMEPLEDWERDAVQRVIFDPTYFYLDRGGKMLRSILTGIVLEAYGASAERAKLILAGVELMEDSTIMLDDIWDDSELRRGGPCGHRIVGEEQALCSGFSVFGHSIKPILSNYMDIPVERHRQCLDLLAWETMHMTLAQGIEIIWTIEDWPEVGESEYFQETISRCAFLSFRGELNVACCVAGAPERDREWLARYGEYVLMAYHLRGDILDLKPEDAEWGKVGGEDISTGRRTAPIIYALDKAEPSRRGRLLEIMAARTLDRDLLAEAVGIVEETGAFEYVARRAEEMAIQADECVEQLSMPSSYKTLLRAFTAFTYQRKK